MAKVTKNLLALISGKVGQVVFKVLKGKLYVSSRPKKGEPSNTPNAVKTRNNFSVVSPFSKSITDDFNLKYLWERSNLKGDDSRSRIMSVNVRKQHKGEPVESFSLIPGTPLFQVQPVNISWQGSRCSFSIDPAGILTHISAAPLISANGVMYLSEPAKENIKPLTFISASSDQVRFSKK